MPDAEASVRVLTNRIVHEWSVKTQTISQV